jgi:hypothetical protein
MSGTKLYYVASPYTTPFPQYKEKDWDELRIIGSRYMNTKAFCAQLVKGGFKFISPILHFHHLALSYNIDKGPEYWWPMDRTLIEHCDAMVVFCDEGWETSLGVTNEIAHARMLEKPIVFLDNELREIKPDGFE